MSIHHAHVSTESRDCDGRYTGGYTMFYNEAEIAETQKPYNDFSDILFRERVMGNVVSLTTHRDGQKAKVEIDEFGFTYSRDTDEGYEYAEVIWCTDDCEDERGWRRDHTAEAMGY